MAQGRPQVDDPKVQRAIYPPQSMWEQITKLADSERRAPAQMVVILLEDALNARKGKP